ncbi:hypothetical protein K466DRAFT_599236 [Polyporus arcularius HHB13444]|uniref:F-box domain-containing protein n=1 Tax=Polyporus arcularius HHB13444 TaxID=1314778 RepID=A0A5C3PP13_9APHY|nr:hypothetical protein K466DRAFT_599236 [Polyporus arcularius HHB13444]
MAHISSEERARLGGLIPAEAQALTSRLLQENQANISTLLERQLELSRLHNSVALFHVKLPVEILVTIFRLAGPLTSPQDAIRLTHVCRAWRTLIHNTPVFWTDFLCPPPGNDLADGTKHPFIVLDAIARTAPMRFTLWIFGRFLPTIRTPSAGPHLSRLTALYLDCRTVEDKDMRPFYDLSLPTLDSLELRLDCSILTRPTDSAESPDRFPRLRALTTTCVSFPLAWVGSSLRVLNIRAGGEQAKTPYDARILRCCCLRSVFDLVAVLKRCPDLEELKLFGCLPYFGPHMSQALPVMADSPLPRLDHLDCLKVGDDLGYVRWLLEHFALRPETFLSVCTDSTYDAFSEFLPVRNPLQAIPLLREVEVSVCLPAEQYPHSVLGYAEEADGVTRTRLALLSSDKVSGDALDLLRLFRGLAPIFSPTAVIDLEVTLCEPVRRGQVTAWSWLLRYFPRLVTVTLKAANASGDFFSALAQEGTVPDLLNLRIVLTGAEDMDVVYEEMVSALELRASRGLRLKSFVYRQQMKCERVGELPCPLPVNYVKRLQAIVSKVEVLLPCYVD